MPYEPIVPDGHHLGTSRNVDGAVTGHIFEDGTNDLKGHAAWQWVDDAGTSETHYSGDSRRRDLTPEQEALADALAELIMLGITKAVEAARPHVTRWWRERAVPRVRSTWVRVTTRRTKPKAAPAPKEPPTVIVPAPIAMTEQEWQQRFRAMLAAGEFRDEQQRILSRARIVEQAPAPAVEAAPAQLTPQQFADRIRSMLEQNPSLLEDETSAELARVFAARDASTTHPQPRLRELE